MIVGKGWCNVSIDKSVQCLLAHVCTRSDINSERYRRRNFVGMLVGQNQDNRCSWGRDHDYGQCSAVRLGGNIHSIVSLWNVAEM